MYWFGDEFDLIDQIDRQGFWRWTWSVFAENFAPVFKVLWGGSVLVFGGSYEAMMVLVWVTHAVNVWILGRLMRNCGVSWSGTLLAQALFGLAPANIESLAWSVQWSAILSETFLLLALDGFFRKRGSWLVVAWSAGSAFTFSRGALTGCLLAAAALVPGPGAPSGRSFPKRIGWAAAYAAPALAAALVIMVFSGGNHRHMAGNFGQAAIFGAWYFSLSPVHCLLSVESWGWRTVILLGLLKVSLAAFCFARSRGDTRRLFAVLVLLDLGNAVLLGIGRFHTGLAATISSRYQYAALTSWAPLAGFAFSSFLGAMRLGPSPRAAAAACLILFSSLAMCQNWERELIVFTTERGVHSRQIVLLDPHPDSFSVPGIPFMPMWRARELVARYNLH